MTPTKRLLPLVALSLGAIGIAVCAAGIFGTWWFGSRLNRATRDVAVQIDLSLESSRGRVDDAQERVQAAAIRSEDIRRLLKKWTAEEARERVSARLGIEEAAQRLESSLQRADHWLEFSLSSVHLIKQVLELGHSTGAPVEADMVDGLLEDLGRIRLRLQEATETIETIRQHTSGTGEEKSLRAKIDQLAHLALRLIATLGAVDERLGNLAGRLSEAQAKARNVEAKAQRWVRIVMTGVTVLILWMAAGQFSLCICGWRRLRRHGAGQALDKTTP